MRFLEGEGKGIITSAEAGALGCGPTVRRSMVRAKVLVRVGQGAYVSAAALNPPADHPARRDEFALAEHRHLLRLDAVLRSKGKKVAASHQSAALAWGLPVLAASLDRVQVIHTSHGRTSRRLDGLTIHRCDLDGVVTRHDGRLVVVPALAVIGQAMEVGLLQGVASMDAALVAKRTTRDDIAAMLDRMRRWPGVGLARRALELADGLAESPPETSLRMILVSLGHVVIAQHWVRVGDRLHYRVDFYLPELGVVLEYDGGVKYSPDRDALVAEKKREDALRLHGFGVGRVTSSDMTPEKVKAIIKKAAQQAQPGARHRAAEPPHWATS